MNEGWLLGFSYKSKNGIFWLLVFFWMGGLMSIGVSIFMKIMIIW